MESKRVLMVATVAATIGSFNMENIRILQELGYIVDVAANFKDVGVWSKERLLKFENQLNELKIEYIQLDFLRNPLKLDKHVASFKEAVKLLEKKQYSFIHTHTPIASAIMRLAAHKTKTKIIYTAHGFHFYNGAPLKNWVIYYPIEKYLSNITDVLITINQEDYKRASDKFKAKKTVNIFGVGVDTENFKPRESGREKIRIELGLKPEQTMLLSVGELNVNKNHLAVIKAIAGIKNIMYVIVGKGELKEKLKVTAEEYGVNLYLMGFRNDVSDIYGAADVYVLPSIREGLNVSLMEAMASGLPCCVGRIRGNVDLLDEKGGYLFNPYNTKEIRNAIESAIRNRGDMGTHNVSKIRSFDKKIVEDIMKNIYIEINDKDKRCFCNNHI